MKTKHLFISVLFFVGLISRAQEETTNVVLHAFLARMLDNTPNAIPNSASSCNIAGKINQIDLKTLIPNLEDLDKSIGDLVLPLSIELIPLYHGLADQVGGITYAEYLDDEDYSAFYHATLTAYDETDNFIDFIKKFQGKNLADLSFFEENDLLNSEVGLRAYYEAISRIFSEKYLIGSKDVSLGGCGFTARAYRTVKKFTYPNITYEYRIEVVSQDCPCKPTGDATKIKDAFFTITATAVQSVFIDKNRVLGDPIGPTIDIIREECCPESERDPLSELSVPKNKGNFFVGVHGGIPLGDEANLFGLAFGASAGYLIALSNQWAIGGRASYNSFSGKETDFGFETDALSHVTLGAMATYYITSNFGLNASAGYAIAGNEAGKSGLNYLIGLAYNLQKLELLIQYMNLPFGQGNIGSVTLGVNFKL